MELDSAHEMLHMVMGGGLFINFIIAAIALHKATNKTKFDLVKIVKGLNELQLKKG